MPQGGMPGDTTEDSESSGLGRRKMLALSGVAVGGLAGCAEDTGGDTDTSVSAATRTPRVETVVNTEVVTVEGKEETVVKTEVVEEEVEVTPEPEIKEETLDVTHSRLPSEMSFNDFNPDGDTTMKQRINTNTFTAFFDGRVESTAVESRNWDPDNLVWELNWPEDDPITWWNGDAYTAEDFWIGQITNHIMFGDGSYWEKEPELVDETTARFYPPVERAEIFMASRYAGSIRQHREQWQPFLEMVRDASSDDELTRIQNKEVSQYEAGWDHIIENGYGTGPYYPVTVNDQEVVLRRRDLVDDVPDHPFNEQMSIPEWRINIVGGQSANDQMIADDQIDMGGGSLPNRFSDITPRYIQTLDTVTQPFGHNLQFNLKDKHLANKWVRRAVIAAMDPVGMRDNAEVDAEVVSSNTGMPDFLNDRYLGEGWADQLYNYPAVGTNMDKVEEWMQKAGYSMNSDGKWEDSDGEVPQWRVKGSAGWSVRQRTLLSQLQEAGFDGEVQSYGWGNFEQQVREDYNYEIATFQYGCWGRIPHPWCFYRGDKHLNMNYGYKSAELQNLVDEGRTTSDLNEKPIIAEIPDEIGSLELGDSTTEVNMIDVMVNLEGGVNTQENARLGAQFTNYYVTRWPLWISRAGAWGDTENFEWPPKGDDIYKSRQPHRNAMKQGILQASFE